MRPKIADTPVATASATRWLTALTRSFDSNIALFKMRDVEQMELDLTRRTWGGKRDGAGRKKQKGRHDSPHRSRPQHVARYPVHVVLRAVPEVGRLRRPAVHEATCRALVVVSKRVDFRVVHISVQHNHVHAIVEADTGDALESGMRALAISLARRINAALDRRGKVFAFRYHATSLTTPTQTRNAICYVLNNWRRHNEDERELAERTAVLDRYSSAISFAGWQDWKLRAWPPGYAALPVVRAETWLLARGWELARHPIKTTEVPGRIG